MYAITCLKYVKTSSNQRLWRHVRRFPAEVSLKKAIGAVKRQSGHQISNFPACKAQGNQHKIRIAFFKQH